MSAIQYRITEFLELELHHSLGSYRRAVLGLTELDRRIDEDRLRHELREDYVFLRDLEHALQAQQDRQTQTLPGDPENQARLKSVVAKAKESRTTRRKG